MPDFRIFGQRPNPVPVRLHKVELRILIAAFRLAKDQPAAILKPMNETDIVVVIGKLLRRTAGRIDDPDLGCPGYVGQICDLIAVRREGWSARRLDIQILLDRVAFSICKDIRCDDRNNAKLK